MTTIPSFLLISVFLHAAAYGCLVGGGASVFFLWDHIRENGFKWLHAVISLLSGIIIAITSYTLVMVAIFIFLNDAKKGLQAKYPALFSDSMLMPAIDNFLFFSLSALLGILLSYLVQRYVFRGKFGKLPLLFTCLVIFGEGVWRCRPVFLSDLSLLFFFKSGGLL